MKSDFLIKKLHLMDEFGPVHGTIGEIRADTLESRARPLVSFPHKHEFYQILVITRGSGWHEIDFGRYPIRPGQLHFTKRGQVHQWKMSPRISGYVIEFNDAAVVQSSTFEHRSWSVEQLPSQLDLASAGVTRRAHIMDLACLIHDEYMEQAPDFELAMRHYLLPILIEMHRLIGAEPRVDRGPDSVVDRFLVLVEGNFRTEHGVEFYARALKTTPKALTMRVSRALGMSARAVVHGRCLLEAKRLLGYSNLALSRIGYETGFSDPAYFSRFFKKSTGETPGEFRFKFLGCKQAEHSAAPASRKRASG